MTTPHLDTLSPDAISEIVAQGLWRSARYRFREPYYSDDFDTSSQLWDKLSEQDKVYYRFEASELIPWLDHYAGLKVSQEKEVK